MDRQLRTYAYGKLNLILKVVGKRPDGYHLLEMLNCCVNWGDLVEVSCSKGSAEITLEVEGLSEQLNRELEDIQTNLASRVAREFLDAFNPGWDIGIKIKKSIPLGAGMAGGSSNAAAVLRVLERLYLEDHPDSEQVLRERLPDLALKLGADVPYLLVGGTCIVRGVGEELEPLEAEGLSGKELALLFPPRGLETASVFSHLQVGGTYGNFGEISETSVVARGSGEVSETSTDIAKLLELELERGGLLRNDLISAACEVYPELESYLAKIGEVSETSFGMTGSGSTLFCLPREGSRFSETAREQLKSLSLEQGLKLVVTSLLANSDDCCRVWQPGENL